MGSRAISALIFGLCFGIILTTISFFAPSVSSYTCNGKTARQYSFPGGASIGNNAIADCTSGTGYEGIGFPYQVKKRSTDEKDYVGIAAWGLYPTAIAGNFFAYGSIGFIFFFIFSRTRHKPKAKKNKGSEE